MANVTYSGFADALLESVPEFKEIWEEHRVFHHDFLNHLLVGEFFDYLVDLASGSTASENADILRRSFNFIERCAKSSDAKVVDLLHASFFPSIDPKELWYRIFGPYIGPESKRLLHRFHLPGIVGKGRPDLPRPD